MHTLCVCLWFQFAHVKPIVTPRFALSCSSALLSSLGEIAKKNDLHIQVSLLKTMNMGLPQNTFTWYTVAMAGMPKACPRPHNTKNDFSLLFLIH